MNPGALAGSNRPTGNYDQMRKGSWSGNRGRVSTDEIRLFGYPDGALGFATGGPAGGAKTTNTNYQAKAASIIFPGDLGSVINVGSGYIHSNNGMSPWSAAYNSAGTILVSSNSTQNPSVFESNTVVENFGTQSVSLPTLTTAVGGILYVSNTGACSMGTTVTDFISNTAFACINGGTLTASQVNNYLAEATVVNAGNTLTTRTGFRVADAGTGGTITTQYGLYVPALAAGTTNWGVYNLSNGYTGGTSTFVGASTFNNQVTFAAGTASVPSVLKTAGTILTTPLAGADEYDGVNSYITNETTSGRGLVPVEQYFHLTAAGSGITTIANFFGANSNISLVANAYYEIDIYAFFAIGTTASAATWTFTNSSAPTSMNIDWRFSQVAGITATAAATELFGAIYNSTTAAQTIAAASMTASTNQLHVFKILLKNGSGTSLKIQLTETTTTTAITPGIGSFWKCKRIPAANVGTFSA